MWNFSTWRIKRVHVLLFPPDWGGLRFLIGNLHTFASHGWQRLTMYIVFVSPCTVQFSRGESPCVYYNIKPHHVQKLVAISREHLLCLLVSGPTVYIKEICFSDQLLTVNKFIYVLNKMWKPSYTLLFPNTSGWDVLQHPTKLTNLYLNITWFSVFLVCFITFSYTYTAGMTHDSAAHTGSLVWGKLKVDVFW